MEIINIIKKTKISKKLAIVLLPLLLIFAAIFGVLTSRNMTVFASGHDLSVDYTEQRVISTATLNDDFCDHSVIVTLNGQATRQFLVYTPENFPEIDVVGISDLTAATVGYAEQQLMGRSSLFTTEQFSSMSGRSIQSIDMKTDATAFRRILQLTLYERCKQNVLNTIRILEQRDDVWAAEPDFRVEPPNRTPNDPGFTVQNFHPTDHWALRNMSLSGAWSFATGRAEVVVGIIDTGINFGAHPDLANRMDTRRNVHRHFLSSWWWDSSGVSETPFDIWVGLDAEGNMRTGHGTQTASIIGAAGNTGAGMTGINWDVRMVSLRVYDNRGGNTSALIRAINYAASINIPILYLGFQGTGASNSQQNSIRSALNSFTGLAISAVGNWGRDVDNPETPTFPASIQTTRHISVGAINRIDRRAVWNSATDHRHRSSNWGATSVHVWAYGVDVLSINANGAFHAFGGTSAAGPLVTGIAALLQSVDLSITPYQIKSAILNNVDDLPNINGLSVTDGRPNAHRAMASLVFRTTPVFGGLRIDGFRNGYTFPAGNSMDIPDTINGQPVVQIGSLAFAWNNTIREVIIPEGVVSIGDRAFYRAMGITNITIPASVRQIGTTVFRSNVFDGTGSLRRIDVHPNNVVFKSVDGILYGDNRHYIWFEELNIFHVPFDISGRVTIPYRVRGIGWGDFALRQNLTHVTIPASVRNVSPGAFGGNVRIEWHYNPALTGIDNIRQNLEEVIIPDTVRHIADGRFANMPNLAFVTFTGTPRLETIGDNAFASSGLVSINIPRTVTSIGNGAFSNNSRLSSVTFGTNSQLTVIDGHAFAFTGISQIELPANLTSIGSAAFAGTNLTSINIPISVESIGNGAFSNTGIWNNGLGGLGDGLGWSRTGVSTTKHNGSGNFVLRNRVFDS